MLTVAVLLLSALWLAMPPRETTAAPMAAPTPVTQTQRGAPGVLSFWGSPTALTADGNSAVLDVADFEIMDLHYVIDQGTTNTITLKIQMSNDNVNWTDGTTIVTNNAADTSVMQQYHVFGRFARINADVVNANAVTVTVISLGK